MATTTRLVLLALMGYVIAHLYLVPWADGARPETRVLRQRQRRDCISCGQDCSPLCRVPDRRWRFCCMNYARRKKGYGLGTEMEPSWRSSVVSLNPGGSEFNMGRDLRAHPADYEDLLTFIQEERPESERLDKSFQADEGHKFPLIF